MIEHFLGVAGSSFRSCQRCDFGCDRCDEDDDGRLVASGYVDDEATRCANRDGWSVDWGPTMSDTTRDVLAIVLGLPELGPGCASYGIPYDRLEEWELLEDEVIDSMASDEIGGEG